MSHATQPVPEPLYAKARLSANGRIVIPAEIRKEMGIQPGETLMLEFKNKALTIETFEARIRRVQRSMRRYIQPGRSLADELIAERREEARREEEEFQRDREKFQKAGLLRGKQISE